MQRCLGRVGTRTRIPGLAVKPLMTHRTIEKKRPNPQGHRSRPSKPESSRRVPKTDGVHGWAVPSSNRYPGILSRSRHRHFFGKSTIHERISPNSSIIVYSHVIVVLPQPLPFNRMLLPTCNRYSPELSVVLSRCNVLSCI